MNFNPDALLTDLMRDEGVKLMPYTDTVGKLTIGIGRNLTDRGVSKEEAIQMARADIAMAVGDLDKNAPWWRSLSPVRQCALANMCFNLGWPKLSKFVDMLAALKAGDWDKAAAEALDSKWADETDGKLDGNDGQRSLRLAQMIREG